VNHTRETARADARTPAGPWICRICRGLWTAVDESAHTRPQSPWKPSPDTLRVTPDVSHSSLEIPAKDRRDSHSSTAPTTRCGTLLSEKGRTTETVEAGHLNTRKSQRVASLRTLSTFARNHCPPSSEYASALCTPLWLLGPAGARALRAVKPNVGLAGSRRGAANRPSGCREMRVASLSPQSQCRRNSVG
jgi:hypothetical protein